eukprot:scpid66893/ scgid23599/ 
MPAPAPRFTTPGHAQKSVWRGRIPGEAENVSILCHVVVADFVDSHSSSSLLLKSLTHFGACCSVSSLECLKGHAIACHATGGLKDQLPLHAFNFTTIDNIDRRCTWQTDQCSK